MILRSLLHCNAPINPAKPLGWIDLLKPIKVGKLVFLVAKCGGLKTQLCHRSYVQKHQVSNIAQVVAFCSFN